MQVCSYINRPKFQYKDVYYKAPGTRQFLNYKCISSYYLIKVQVSMVKHVYEQKYSGNLQTDHFGKHVPEGKNGNSTRNQIHNGWQKYILNCNDLTYQPSNEYYNPIDEISFWPFHSSHIKIPSQTKYGYHQQIKKKIHDISEFKFKCKITISNWFRELLSRRWGPCTCTAALLHSTLNRLLLLKKADDESPEPMLIWSHVKSSPARFWASEKS
jgi:hypothetical protein